MGNRRSSFRVVTRKGKRIALAFSKGNASTLSKNDENLMGDSLSDFVRLNMTNSVGELHSVYDLPFHSRSLSVRAKFKYGFSEDSTKGLFRYINKSYLSKDIDNSFNPNDQTFISQLVKVNSNKTNVKGTSMASIVHSDNSISTRLFAKWITSNYAFSLDKFISIQEPTIEKILQDSRFERTLTLDGGYTNYLAINDDAMLIISQSKVENEQERSEVYFEIFSKNIDIYYEYYNYVMDLDKASKLDTLIIEYHSISTQRGFIDSNVEYFKKDIFDDVIDDFYTPYLDTEVLFDQFMKSRSVMLQLTGKPGIGKSKLIALFVKYLIEHPEYSKKNNIVKIARPASSEVLAQEDFWVKLRQEGFQALILDDVDHILQKRNDSVNSSEEKIHNEIIRKILTFTDGLTSQKSKILISTNLEYHKIDKALIRDFRLFDSIELRALTYKEAKHIWVHTYGLENKQFKTIFKDIDEITAAKLAKEIESSHNYVSLDTQDTDKSYLKEDGVSKVKSLRARQSRIGLV